MNSTTNATNKWLITKTTSIWKATDNLNELHNIEFEVTKILLTNSYIIQENGKMPIIKNMLGHEGLRFI